MNLTRRGLLLYAALPLLGLVAATPWLVPRLLWTWELNPVLRGRLLAEEAGCLACHLPPRGREIPNVGSRWNSVPKFEAGNGMMYDATTRAQIEEYVRYGAPRAWLDDPKVAARLDEQQIRMPAYEDRYDDAEIADLVLWTATIEGVEPPEGVVEGRALAQKHGCLACHGVAGSGGLPNPGSPAGFIPGFLGRNFSDLVRDEEEFREWVLDGRSTRLSANPFVRWAWDRQKIAMPAYRDVLQEKDLEMLWKWIEAERRALR